MNDDRQFPKLANDDRLFPKLTPHQIECAIESGETVELSDGQEIFHEGAARADFFVILDGKIKVVSNGNGQETVLAMHGPGQFTGTTDLLTGEMATATGYAVGPTRVARVPVEKFNELIMACPEMRSVLLPALMERRTTEYRIQSQQQKLTALGKMSAGLAHELNNPAAAVRRSAQTLNASLTELEDLCCSLLNALAQKAGTPDTPLTKLCELARQIAPELDPLVRSEREDSMCQWLTAIGVEQPWEVAASLVSAGLSREQLEPVAGAMPGGCRAKLLRWLAKDVEMRQMCSELDLSAGRMVEIVGAMKVYSHMDQANAMAPTDLLQGLKATYTVLKHRLKQKNITMIKEIEPLPPVMGFAGELNQVWTNLLSNAIDAAPQDGHITVVTKVEGKHAVVKIIDDGPGIPPEVQPRIFEPFFTTKGVGAGTGLGLDITYRIVKSHNGDIRFETRPGRTAFIVWLPLAAT